MGDGGAAPRIAMVAPEPFVPPTSGGQLRMTQHFSVLRRVGCRVQAAVLVDHTHPFARHDPEGAIHIFPVSAASPTTRLGELARGVLLRRHPRTFTLHAAMQRALESTKAWKPDLVLLEYSLLATFLPEVRRTFPGVPVIVDAHNAEATLLAEIARASGGLRGRMENRMRAWWFRRIEGVMVPRADEVWAASEADAAALRAMGSHRVRVIPNAVDTDAYAPASEAGQDVLVFTGTMDYPPNIDGAEWLCRGILPAVRREVPGIHLYLVGKSATRVAPLAGPGVTVTGMVADPRRYFAQATVVVVPLRVGSGTRLKILEALAMQKAVVTTRVGCQGLDIRDETHVLIADNAEAFARAVLRALRDAELRRRLGEAGRRLVEERYSWNAAARIIPSTLVGSLLAAVR